MWNHVSLFFLFSWVLFFEDVERETKLMTVLRAECQGAYLKNMPRKQRKYPESNQICWDFLRLTYDEYFYIIVTCTVNHLIHQRIDVCITKSIWTSCHNDSLVLLVFFEDIHIWIGSLSVLGLHGVLLGTQKRSWNRLALCSPLACQEGLQRQAVLGLAAGSLAWHRAGRRFHQYRVLMNGNYIHSAHQWLPWWWSISRWKTKLTKKTVHWYKLILFGWV